ncbi:hypothetical protein [Burkholderia contaminans]|uniref:hypothetical protein n=1 Tax=Burkholderia contaminans TaxID=488447 RepID=UPI001CF4D92D|nr:hypothetical protein [Burkholderia contaminans]MCA8102923.1 hypothetical protein [Burkholderia contaminans]
MCASASLRMMPTYDRAVEILRWDAILQTPHEPSHHTMHNSITCLTHPVVCDDSSLLFSAYGHGWGYAAVKLPAAVVLDKLGASAVTPDHLVAAFELHQERIARAISRHEVPDHGERIQLNASDF